MKKRVHLQINLSNQYIACRFIYQINVSIVDLPYLLIKSFFFVDSQMLFQGDLDHSMMQQRSMLVGYMS
jgi:hypothetical protein